MNTIHAEVSDVIDARPEQVYAVLADYGGAHKAILPQPYFTDLTIEEGGHGAGTVYRLRVNVWGREFKYHHQVSEPEPGRVLVEADMDTTQYSSFTLDPVNGGSQTRVTISAHMPSSAGLLGVMERLFTPSMQRKMFRQELRNLADYLRSKN
jgi:hypothetical protein